MRIVARLFAALVVLSMLAPRMLAAEPQELARLWKPKKRFGPDAAGTLVIERSGGGYVADFAGRVLPVRVEGGELAFELPDGGGAFRGKVDGTAINGHWVRPRTDVNAHAASPVWLVADGVGGGGGTWRRCRMPTQGPDPAVQRATRENAQAKIQQEMGVAVLPEADAAAIYADAARVPASRRWQASLPTESCT